MKSAQVTCSYISHLETKPIHSNSVLPQIPFGTSRQSTLRGCCSLHVPSSKDEYEVRLISLYTSCAFILSLYFPKSYQVTLGGEVRQNLTLQPKMAQNSLGSSSCPKTHNTPSCLCLADVRIIDVSHHTQESYSKQTIKSDLQKKNTPSLLLLEFIYEDIVIQTLIYATTQDVNTCTITCHSVIHAGLYLNFLPPFCL